MSPRTARTDRGKQGSPDLQLAAKCKQRLPGGSGVGDAGLSADAQWEVQLPAGLKAEQCAGLPQTVSVRQLVEVRTRESRREAEMSVRTCAAVAVASACSTCLSECHTSCQHNILTPVNSFPNVHG